MKGGRRHGDQTGARNDRDRKGLQQTIQHNLSP
jgi:hypothetical protein